jgi:hypothetical protein
MKQIIENKYLKSFNFSSSEEASNFFNNQKAKRCLAIKDTFGENYYCYVCYHSLTQEKEFILSFSSDENEDSLNLLFWNNTLVFDTGKRIYLLDEYLNIKTSLEISICLIGLYLITNDRLLILEEASFKVTDYIGKIIMSESLNLIEDYNIEDNVLSIQTSEENIVFELI